MLRNRSTWDFIIYHFIIMEENKLIAEFLGWKLQDNPTDRWYGSYREPNGILHKNTDKEPLLFHTSWDWLMPVVAKITRDEKYLGNVYREHLMDIVPYGYEEDTCDAVVEFIKQYNK